jgi:DNA-binding CsgD family transcriptional regulator
MPTGISFARQPPKSLAVVNTSLDIADYQLLLSCIEGIHRCRKLEDFPKNTLLELKRLVPSQLACYAEMDFTRNRAINVFEPEFPGEPKVQKWMNAVYDHPVINYFKSTGDGQALKISDFVSADELHQLNTYKNAFSDTGAEDQLAFGVQVESRFVIGICFDRGERTFTERDRMFLNLIRPHIIQTYILLEELAGHEELQHDLEGALRANGLGVLILNHAKEVVHATPGTWDKLSAYLPVPDNEKKLPETIEHWAFAKAESGKGDAFILSGKDARLILRRVRQSDNRLMLFLSEESSTTAADRMAEYRLTRREHEVLRHIAEGKSNAEIAMVLGVSAGTIKLHVEHVLEKLGVDNRIAAAWVLRDGAL